MLNRRYFYKNNTSKRKNSNLRKCNKIKKEIMDNKNICQLKKNLLCERIDISSKVSNEKIDKMVSFINKSIKFEKQRLLDELDKNNSLRYLNSDLLKSKDLVSLFDSSLIRTMGIPIDSISEDLIIVQTFYFKVLEDIIKYGFIHKGHKYIPFTASAGQIRTKKTLFIRESAFKRVENTLTCGLTPEAINKQGGVNINKYLAYLALCNSATNQWKDFNIKKSIVVEDMETMVDGYVDFIDDSTYKITRQLMGVPIEHTDGCGMMLPRVASKSRMVRLPWVKGLLVPFPFDEFIRDNNKRYPNRQCGLVTDIYGKTHDILKDDIEIIFTKSQFKMWKYYNAPGNDGWEDYIEKYEKYRCHASYCNEEADYFGNAKLNYQMLQTLTDMTKSELEYLCEDTINDILNIGKDRETMLKILGVTSSNQNKNYIQQALEIYPELLSDAYSKEIIKQTKASFVKRARSGRIEIDGKYTFIIPDLYAFCQHLFLGAEKPKGLLKNGEVYCKLYGNDTKLDCLRSPHLYREHAVRTNIVDKERDRWFITNGLYTSSYDLINKLLQCDNDGDTSLVVGDQEFVKIAERHMEGIVPLYYNMKSSNPSMVNSDSIYQGLTNAYKGGNIGMISNDITKIWNSDKPCLDAVKLLTMENNFVIDYAKTLYKPVRPHSVSENIVRYTKSKAPNFFVYAKDKTKQQVERLNKSTVNRLKKIIPNPRISFKKSNVGKMDYRDLMRNQYIELEKDCPIITTYKSLSPRSRFMISGKSDKIDHLRGVYLGIRKDFLEINPDKYEVVDILIKYLYVHKKSSMKTTLWECFGDVIIENLKKNIDKPLDDGWLQCEVCGIRIENYNNRKYCSECQKDVNRKKTRARMRDIRKNV